MKKILVVDDDAVIRKLVSFNLEHKSYKVFQAETAEVALRLLLDEEIDLVICDIMMNKMDGFEFCRIIRSKETYKHLPFIFLSSRESLADKSKGYEMGADDFITKPFDVEELILKSTTLIKRSEVYKNFSIKKSFKNDIEERTKKILLIDDDEMFCEILKGAMETKGFLFQYSIDPNQGLEIVRDFQPDLIISDYNMPDINGKELRKLLLKHETLKQIPFLFLTSNLSEKNMLECFEYDIKDYILKDTSLAVIAAKISNIIETTIKERNTSLVELKNVADSLHLQNSNLEPPEMSSFRIKSWLSPYKSIPGGDFIDFITLPNNKTAIIMGDIMGKRWGAWFYTFSFISYIRSTIRVVLNNDNQFSAGEILTKVNLALYDDSNVSDIYSSISILVLDDAEKIISYAGAGDLPLMLFRSRSKSIDLIESSNPLLGVKRSCTYDNIEIPMNDRDSIILFSDGITESRNLEGTQFGTRRINLLLNNINETEKELTIFEAIKEDFIDFTGNSFEDDVSLCVITKIN